MVDSTLAEMDSQKVHDTIKGALNQTLSSFTFPKIQELTQEKIEKVF